jgi:hypothetical protein
MKIKGDSGELGHALAGHAAVLSCVKSSYYENGHVGTSQFRYKEHRSKKSKFSRDSSGEQDLLAWKGPGIHLRPADVGAIQKPGLARRGL